jgi:hypothetical protein
LYKIEVEDDRIPNCGSLVFYDSIPLRTLLQMKHVVKKEFSASIQLKHFVVNECCIVRRVQY